MNGFRRNVERFADRQNVKVNYIVTNITGVLNEALLTVKYRNHIRLQRWWAISHGIIQISLCAPFSVGRIGTLFTASSGDLHFLEMNGSDPRIDNEISWGDFKVRHDAFEYNRQEKIRYILKNFIRKEGYYPILIVCNFASAMNNAALNCQCCEKCYRTIVGLYLEDIDPNRCGFNVTDDFLDDIKMKINKGYVIKDYSSFSNWIDIINMIPEKIEDKSPASRQFFKWLRGLDCSKMLYKNLTDLSLRYVSIYIYSMAPRKFREPLLNTYYKFFQ